MKNSKIEQIKNLYSDGFELDFSQVFEKTISNYKKIALYGGLFLILLLFCICILFAFGVYAFTGSVDSTSLVNVLQQMAVFQLKPLSETYQIYAAIILFTALMGPFNAGFIKMANCADIDQEFNFIDMFSYYKSPYFSTVFLFVLVITVINNAIVISVTALGMSWIGAVLNAAISFFTLLSIPLIIFDNFTAFEAIKYSFLIVSKKPLVILGLIITSYLIGFLGVFGLCIGVFFTIPIVYSVYYIIYKSIVGIENETEINQIGSKQV